MLQAAPSLPVHMPSIEFLPLAVNPSDYPKSHLLMLPSLPRIVFSEHVKRKVPSAFTDCQNFFVYGRYALVEALKRAGVAPGSVVLLPAYHCRTIVESVLHLGAEARFYPMTAELRPDFPSMHDLVTNGAVRTLLMTHYFGFANALDEARRFCEMHKMALIEDCAHAFYGEHEGQVLGTVGHFSVASAWKFLPLRDGAMLRDNTGITAAMDLKRQPIKDEIKAMLSILQGWMRARLKKRVLPEVDVGLLNRRALEISAAIPVRQVTEEIQFQPDRVEMAGMATSRWMVSHAAHDPVMRRRRENYLHWLAGVQGLQGVRPLFPELPDGVVPYAFPLLTDAGGLVFHALKLAGIPIWRWEDVAKTECPVSLDYRLRLLQLPCHQDLSREEIDWMLLVLHGVVPGLLV